MAIIELEDNGVVYEIDTSSLNDPKYRTKDGEFNIDIIANDLRAQNSDMQPATESAPVPFVDNTPQGRGNNLAGGARNVLQGLTFGLSDELEAAVRSRLPESLYGIKDYDVALQNAREAQKGYAAQHPGRALALQIGGGLLPSLLTLGATAPASGLSAANMAARGLATGLGYGALQGFGEGEGGVGDRISSALSGAAVGGAAGALLPALASGGARVWRGARMIGKGLKENAATPGETADKIVQVLHPDNEDAIDNAALLAGAVSKGDKTIRKGAQIINNIFEKAKKATSKGYKPSVVEGYTELENSLMIPEMKAANAAYDEFASQVPQGTNSGLAIASFFRKHPEAKKIYSKYAERSPNVKPNSFEGMRDINSALRNRLQRARSAENYALADDIENAMADLAIIRENTTPGIRAIDKQWSIAKNAQDVATDKFSKYVRSIEKPKERLSLEISATGAAREGFGPQLRGEARDLLQLGRERPAYSGSESDVVQKILAPLKRIPKVGGIIGDVPLNRAVQAVGLPGALSQYYSE